MSTASTFLGGSAPLGSIVAGQFAGNSKFLACDGTEYAKASYPSLDYTGMTAFGSNAITSRTLPVSQIWSAVAFGNGVFVAVSSTSGTSAASSTDGITWTTRTIPSGVYTSVIYAAGLFVAVGTNVCATSPDGITWTSRTFGTLAKAVVAYGNGLFVAFGSGSAAATTTYITSPDGITWTSRTLGATSYGWGGVRWDAVSGKFLAVADMEATLTTFQGLIFTSSDGLNWTSGYVGPNTAATLEPLTVFGDKWYAPNGAAVLSTEPLSSVSGVTNGWSITTPKGRLATITGGIFKAGEWLFINDGNVVHRTRDGSRWDSERLPSTVTVPLCAAWGNNTLVFIPRTAGASTVAFSWAADTTKFRVPAVRASSEADRLYLKAL